MEPTLELLNDSWCLSSKHRSWNPLTFLKCLEIIHDSLHFFSKANSERSNGTHLGIIEQFVVFELQTQIPKPPHISKFRDNQLFSPFSMPVSPFPRISRGFSLKIHLKKPAGFKKKIRNQWRWTHRTSKDSQCSRWGLSPHHSPAPMPSSLSWHRLTPVWGVASAKPAELNPSVRGLFFLRVGQGGCFLPFVSTLGRV